jgi:hypothetical protein
VTNVMGDLHAHLGLAEWFEHGQRQGVLRHPGHGCGSQCVWCTERLLFLGSTVWVSELSVDAIPTRLPRPPEDIVSVSASVSHSSRGR